MEGNGQMSDFHGPSSMWLYGVFRQGWDVDMEEWMILLQITPRNASLNAATNNTASCN